MKRLIALVLVSLALALAVGAAAARQFLEPPRELGVAVQTFAVSKGSGLARVARELESAGLVRSAMATEW